MALSEQSVSRIANALQDDFSCYLQSYYFDEISELLSEAASNFVDDELGEVDEQLAIDVMLQLVQGVVVA